MSIHKTATRLLVVLSISLILVLLTLSFSTGSSAAATNSYEAESGTYGGGGRIQSASNASGGQVIGALNNQGAYSQIGNVDGGTGGTATLVVRFANGYTSARSLSLYVNDVKVQQVSFAVTGGWNTFQDTAAINITLNAGTNNTIRLQRDASDVAAADIDKYTVNITGSATNTLTPTTNTPGSPRSFVKGINLNGNAVTVDGNTWLSYSAAQSSGFSTSAVNLASTNITWSPSVNTDTSSMLNSVIWNSGGFNMSQTIANGSYQVYFWLVENYQNNYRSVNVSLEGTQVASSIGNMSYGTWQKYGPYSVTVSDGTLNINFDRISGDPLCAGLAIFTNGTTSTPGPTATRTPTPINPTNTPNGGIITSYEAESGVYGNGAAIQSASNASGGQVIGAMNSQGSYSQINNVNGGVGGTATLVIRFANGYTTPRSLSLYVNSTKVQQLSFPVTGGWNTFQDTAAINIVLNSGTNNTIKLQLDSGDVAAADIDKYTVNAIGGPTPIPPTVVPTATYNPAKLRAVVETDGEIDDEATFNRMMAYLNEFNVVALIYGNSVFHPNGMGTTWMNSHINGYDQVDENLRLHDPSFPTADYLRSIVRIGNQVGCKATGPNNNTAASDYLVSILIDSSKSSPIYMSSWGGNDTIVQALWKVKTSYPDKVAEVSAKAILSVLDIHQSTCGTAPTDWVADNYPNLRIVSDDIEFYSMAYSGQRHNPSYLDYLDQSSWINPNVKTGHGGLGAAYPHTYFDGEGDTPSWFYQLDFGLRGRENPSYGNWGGRYIKINYRSSNNFWADTTDDGDNQKPLWRWKEAQWMDWAMRMDWAVQPYSGANHPPVVQVAGGINRTVSAGSTVTLSAEGTTDPDGNTLSYTWWQYYDADTANTRVIISNDTSKTNASFVVPNEPGKTIEIIVGVKDNGLPNITRWQTIIFTIQ